MFLASPVSIAADSCAGEGVGASGTGDSTACAKIKRIGGRRRETEEVNVTTPCSQRAQWGSSHVPLRSGASAGPHSCPTAPASCLVGTSGSVKACDSHGSLLCKVLLTSAHGGRQQIECKAISTG